MHNSNDEIHIRGKVYNLSQMTEDQIDLNNRVSRLLESARLKHIEAEDDEAAAKFYIEKLEQDLQNNYNAGSVASDDNIMFLTMK